MTNFDIWNDVCLGLARELLYVLHMLIQRFVLYNFEWFWIILILSGTAEIACPILACGMVICERLERYDLRGEPNTVMPIHEINRVQYA